MVATSIYQDTYRSIVKEKALANGVALFTDIIEQMPDDVEGYIYRAQCYARLSQPKAALSDITRALKMDSANGYAHYIHGNIRREMLDLQGAVTAYTQAIKAGYLAAHNNRGVVLLHLKKYRAAYGDFTSALENDPTLVRAYHNRGLARCHLKDYRGAIQDLEIAIDHDPDYDRSYMLIGCAFYMVGEDDAALIALKIYSQKSNKFVNHVNLLRSWLGDTPDNFDNVLTATHNPNLAKTEPLPQLDY